MEAAVTLLYDVTLHSNKKKIHETQWRKFVADKFSVLSSQPVVTLVL